MTGHWHRRIVGWLAVGGMVVGCSAGSHPGEPGTADGGADAEGGGDRTLVAIEVAPAAVTIAVGETQLFAVTGSYDDGSSSAITDGLSWDSSAPEIASVSAGVATGLAAGDATITVQVSDKSATAAVTVAEAGSFLLVFGDDYGAGLAYAPFGGATGGPSIDTAEAHSGTTSLRIGVPATGYTGGAIHSDAVTDLSGFQAVSFWAKASQTAALNVAGLGNDGVATAFAAERNAIPLTTTWTQYFVPIPLASRLTAERGLFHFAEGGEEGAYTIWLDDIRYTQLPDGVAASAAPAIATESLSKLVGDTFLVNGASVTWTFDGTPQTIATGRRYFTFTSSDPTVATVDEDGRVTAIATGSSTVTAALGDLAAIGALSLTVTPATGPDGPAPTPTPPTTDVISLFSDAYTAAPVDTWLTSWSNAALADTDIGGDHVKKYSNLVFAGVEFFATQSVDATAMTHFHLDVWTPDSSVLRVKLVDFGADGAFGGGNDTEHELTFDAASTPALVTGSWLSLELPLADFAGLASRAHLSQLILSASTSTVYVDNVYFHH